MKDKIERRFAEGVTVKGRTLTGVAMRYGEVATIKGRRERFQPGAFGAPLPDVVLNFHHERSRPLTRTGAGLKLSDGADALELRAKLPNTRDADDAIELVRQGVLRGLSVEFRATRERRDGGVRVIERAVLLGVGLVDTPAYPGATVEARNADAASSAMPWWAW